LGCIQRFCDGECIRALLCVWICTHLDTTSLHVGAGYDDDEVVNTTSLHVGAGYDDDDDDDDDEDDG